MGSLHSSDATRMGDPMAENLDACRHVPRVLSMPLLPRSSCLSANAATEEICRFQSSTRLSLTAQALFEFRAHNSFLRAFCATRQRRRARVRRHVLLSRTLPLQRLPWRPRQPGEASSNETSAEGDGFVLNASAPAYLFPRLRNDRKGAVACVDGVDLPAWNSSGDLWIVVKQGWFVRDGVVPSEVQPTRRQPGVIALRRGLPASLFFCGRKFRAVAAVPTTSSSYGISGIMIASRLRMPSYLVVSLV
ncbi:hypothetical protein MRX96_012512 [Rhipicephalus microplus]